MRAWQSVPKEPEREERMTSLLEGRLALITGAGSGIGEGIDQGVERP